MFPYHSRLFHLFLILRVWQLERQQPQETKSMVTSSRQMHSSPFLPVLSRHSCISSNLSSSQSLRILPSSTVRSIHNPVGRTVFMFLFLYPKSRVGDDPTSFLNLYPLCKSDVGSSWFLPYPFSWMNAPKHIRMKSCTSLQEIRHS